MRRTLDQLLPSRPEQRRGRLLTALTIAVGAATIAATSAGNGELPARNGSATLSGAQIAPGATVTDRDVLVSATERDTLASATVRDALVPAAERDALVPATERDALVPATERDAATSPLPAADADRIGVIELLAQERPLPSLAGEAGSDAEGDPGDDAEGDAEGDAGGDAGDDADAEVEAAPLAYTAADGEVVTPERIFAFLDGRNAPLAAHAETFVAAGIAHDVDPRVVVAISIAESNGGKMKPAGTHNAWGWGGSGGPSGLRAWDSWERSIDHYTERLGALYDTDNVDWEFASTYCPPNTRWWFDTVTWAIGQI
ncbi:MAG: hypothetical protein EA387_15095 [Nitriliruptor sp.]|nr:MAG: hypothetical protein EA387_15095 [Nitriliruptor sp.]